MIARPALVAAAHELANAVRTSDPDVETAARAQRLIEEATKLLDPVRHGGPYACEQLRPPAEGFHFDREDPCGSVAYAPLTGPLNPAGSAAQLQIVDGGITGTVAFSPLHAGPMGLVHGGALAGVFDEIMALATLAHGIAGFTRRMTVEYRSAAKLDTLLVVQAKVTAADGRDIVVDATISDAGQTVATATASFRKIADLSEDFYKA
jgi:acyl-coenzyme A thioesterase PaaI-like protein